jgi:hypothetical protein
MNEMTFITTNSSRFTLHIGYEDNCIGDTVLQIDNNKNWKNYIEGKINELSGSCYAIRLMVCISNINPLKSIYYAYFHSVIKY